MEEVLILKSLVVLFFTLTFITGCPLVFQKDVPKEYKLFFSMPEKDQCKVFKTYPLETQYSIALTAFARTEPPDSRFYFIIASRGKEVVPFLLSQVENDKDEFNKKQGITILKIMSIYYLKLNDNKEVLEKIRLIISKMSDSTIKYYSNQELEFIEQYKDKEPLFKNVDPKPNDCNFQYTNKETH